MFQLITVIIGIVLVVLIAGIVVYYGGSTYSDASAQAIADRLVNEGTQIKAATQLYASNNGSSPAALADLVSDSELQSVPQNWSYDSTTAQIAWTQTATAAGATIAADKVCSDFNAKIGMPNVGPGITNVPYCAQLPTDLSVPVCCQ